MKIGTPKYDYAVAPVTLAVLDGISGKPTGRTMTYYKAVATDKVTHTIVWTGEPLPTIDMAKADAVDDMLHNLEPDICEDCGNAESTHSRPQLY